MQKIKQEVVEKNKKLCERYPFLIPRNRWDDKINEDYDCSYTELDAMPNGWRECFGEQMCEDILNALIEGGMKPEDYRITQIKEKYGCYDKETEVLTKNGWKYFKDITYKDEIATLNESTNKLEYQKPTDIISYQYNGKMYYLENRGVNLCVTPNHNVYVAKGSYFNGSKNNEKRYYDFELTTPDTYFGKDKRFKKACQWDSKIPDDTYTIKGYTYTNAMKINGENATRTYTMPDLTFNLIDFLKFLGFYVAEGCSNVNKGAISIAFNPFVEYEFAYELIENIGFTPNITQNRCFRIYSKTLAKWLIEECGHLAWNKKVPDFIKELSPEYIEIFLTYLYIGDGHKTKTYNILTTTSKQLSDDVQELLIKCNYGFRESFRKVINGTTNKNGIRNNLTINGRNIISKHDTYEINWLKLNEVEIDMSKAKHTKSFKEEWIDYNDYVYCVTVPNHIIYIRRNGKGVFCGNSLRWYDYGAPQQVYDVITKYEYLSEHVCIICGKINVPMYDNGWISPFCEECAQKCRYSPDDIISPAELKSSFTIRRYSKDKNEEIVFNISDILEKIGYKIEE